MAPTVVLIHDMWLTPAAWENFEARLAACAFECLVPAWPDTLQPNQSAAASITANPSLGIRGILGHYASLVRGLEKPPVLIGHGVGGLIVQLLLDRGLGASGIGINPVPARQIWPQPAGFFLHAPFLFSRNARNRTHTMPFSWFARNYAQTLLPEELETIYKREVVPAPGQVLIETSLGLTPNLHFANDYRVPLLFMSGDQDRIVPPALVSATYRKHCASAVTCDFKLFPGRAHWAIGERGWEDMADYAIEWVQRNT